MTEYLCGCIDGKYYPGAPGTMVGIPPDHIERYQLPSSKAEALGVVIDAGCGAGYGCLFYPLAKKYVGLDNDPKVIGFAQRCYASETREFAVCDILQTPWPQADADMILMFEVIEHQWPAEWPGLIANAWTALKHGGLLCLSCPTLDVGVEMCPAGHVEERKGIVHKRHPEEYEVLGVLKGFQIETIQRVAWGAYGLCPGMHEGGRCTTVIEARRI